MKKFKRILTAFLAAATLATTLSTATLASENTEVEKFNIFRDAGEISDEFMAKTSDITQRNWQDNYFSTIVMTLGQKEMYVDGTKVDLSFAPAIDGDNKLVIPATELAEKVGAEVKVDEKTGKIALETENGTVSIGSEIAQTENAVKAEDRETRDKALSSDGLGNNDTEKITLQDDKSVMTEKADGSVTICRPVVYEEEAERYLGLNVDMHGERLIISNPYQLREIIVYVKNGRNLANDRGAKESVTNGKGLYFLQYETQAQARAAYESFKNDGGIEYVSLNELMSTSSLPSPGSWGTDGTTDSDGNYTSMGIQASRMKNHLAGNNSQIVVAVIDTGADSEYLPQTEGGRQGHIFLSGRTLAPASAQDQTAGWNFIDNNNNPYDDQGHGTHVSGTIVDCTPDNVKIMPVRVMKKDGNTATGTILDIGNGIKKAYQNGASVFNMSIGGACPYSNCYIEQAIDYVTSDALSKGKRAPLFSVAAGNESSDTATVCPAKLSGNHTNVVTVASVEKQDRISGFSNYGDEVDVCAPGNGIFSCVPSHASGTEINGYKYATYNGTSMATPHVTAALAMLCLDNPTLSAEQIKIKLKGMTVDLGTPGEDPIYGSGRIDFRMLSSNGLSAQQPIAATSLEIDEVVGNYNYNSPSTSVTLTSGEINDCSRIIPVVGPAEATNKSATFTVGNSGCAYFNQNGHLQAGAAGNTVVTATKGSLSAQISVTILDNWLNYAAPSYQSGTGTESDPYIIVSAPQLAKLAYETRVNNTRYYGNYFRLEANIDLGGRNWTPIGAVQYKDKQFNNTDSFGGHFDGNGFTVSNLNVLVSPGRIWEYCGLFGFIRGNGDQRAEIKNLAVTNAWVGPSSVEAESNYGLLCGTAFNTDIDSCYAQGTTSGSGLVGWNSVNSIIKNCYVNANCGKGGFVGDNRATVENCYCTGQANKGGFAYYITNNSGTIKNCFTNSSVNDAKTGFVYIKSDGSSIAKGYYRDGTSGVYIDKNPDATDLIQKTEQNFKTKSFFTTASNWDSSSSWDFSNTWDIDARCNNGLPFLRKFQKNVYGISLNKTSMALYKGETGQLTATVTPTYAVNRNVIWSSGNTAIATVDQTGKVTSKATSGTTTITATAADGSGVSANCTFYADDYGNTPEKAATVYMHSIKSGKIEVAYDVDCFKYVADTTGNVIFYTTGSLDTRGYLLDENKNQIATSDDAGISGKNFAIKYNLQSGKTYYIKVGAYSANTGSYTLNVVRGVYSTGVSDRNPDARRVIFNVNAASVLTNLKIQIGSKTYSLTKPASGSLDTTVNGARFNVNFVSGNKGLTTSWRITANIPSGTAEQTVSFTFSKGSVTGVTGQSVSGFLPYKSTVKTNINPSLNLQAVINGMVSTGYSFAVKDWYDSNVTVSSTKKAATGMKIIKTNTSTGKKTEIFYVLLYGDVVGGTDCGNGIIDSSDALFVLQYTTGQVSFPNKLLELAADVNHDGKVDSADALLIQQHTAGTVNINQNVTETNVPDDCYYLLPVAF